MLNIISYNVNGIRSAINKGFLSWLSISDADILCLQEVRAELDQIPVEEFDNLGYDFYLHKAQKRGYSGVGILTKKSPHQITRITGTQYLDGEGRIIRLDYGQFSVISLYLPSGTNPIRLDYKFDFMDSFQSYINQLKEHQPNLIICGDYNICHRAIDIHDPVRNKNVSGFLPEERRWLDNFLKSGFIDSFRHLNTEPHNYTWWSYRSNARARNLGWRIDYVLVSEPLRSLIHRSFIADDIVHSDHCPTGISIDL